MLAMSSNSISVSQIHGPRNPPVNSNTSPLVSMERHRLQFPESPFTLPPIHTLSPPPVPSNHFNSSNLKFTLRPNKLWTEEMTHKLFQCIVDHFETFSKGKKSQVWKLAAHRVGLSPVQCKNKFEEQKKKWEKRNVPSAIPRPKNESDYVADRFFEKYGSLAYPGLGSNGHYSPSANNSEAHMHHHTSAPSPTLPSMASPKSPCNCQHWTQMEYQKYKLDKDMEMELKRLEFLNREKELEVEKLRLQVQLANINRGVSSRRDSMTD